MNGPASGSSAPALPDWWPHRLHAIEQFAQWARGGEAPDWPLELFLEVSNVCDLKCAMCPTFSALSTRRLLSIKETERGFLDSERVLAALEPMLQRALIVHCFGYGEPSLHPGFAELLRQLHPYRVRTDFFTHGMHLEPQFCELLISQQVHAVTVSFSGVERTAYENIYQGGRFDTVLAGLRRLRDAKHQAGCVYPRVEINSLGFEHHVQQLPAFVDLMADHGVDVIHLKALQTYEVTRELAGHCSIARPWVEGPLLEQAQARAQAHGLVLSCEQYWDARVEDALAWHARRGDVSSTIPLEQLAAHASAKQAQRPPPGQSKPAQVNALELAPEALAAAMGFAPEQAAQPSEPFYCFEPFKTVYVRRSGQVKPCCFANDAGPALGSLLSASATDVWRGAPWRALRAGVLTQRYPSALCGDCLRGRYGPRRQDVPNQLREYQHWLEHSWQQSVDLELPEQTLSNTEIIQRARSRPDQVRLLDEVRRLQPFGVPEHLLQGHLDGLRDGQLHGWLRAPEYPELRLSVELRRDGQPWRTLVADRQRDDLREAGIGDGDYGFAVDLQDDPKPGHLEVYLATTEWRLGGIESPLVNTQTPTETWAPQEGQSLPGCGFVLDYDPGIHEQEILRFFSQYADQRPPPQPPPAAQLAPPVVVVLFTNRSGSNLLAEALAATDLVYNAGECCNFSTLEDVCLREGIVDLHGYLNALRAQAKAHQATLMVKLSWDQLFFLTKVGVIPHYWPQPRYLWSRREDLLAQALSAVVAERTGCWTQAYPADLLRQVLEEVTPTQLARGVQHISHAHSQLESYFALHGPRPLTIEYRELAQHPQAQARRVLEALGLWSPAQPWSFDPQRIRVRRQRTPAMEQRLEQLRGQLRLEVHS